MLKDDFILLTDPVAAGGDLQPVLRDGLAYWFSLFGAGEQPCVAFSALTPTGLAPFKDNCAMLGLHHWEQPVVKFVGHKANTLWHDQLSPGVMLYDTSREGLNSSVENALSHLFENSAPIAYNRSIGGEVYQILMLPLTQAGQTIDLCLLLVAKVDINNVEEDSPTDSVEDCVDESQSVIDSLLVNAREVASRVVHVDARTRDTLYEALAGALELYEESEKHPEAYKSVLSAEGMRAQSRAPFTPVLKLVFGKDYDKTRITEYAAALSYARREGQNPASLPAYLNEMPGGIKGCVQAERKERRTARGNFTADKFEQACAALRQADGQALSDLPIENEFSLVLVHKGDSGVKVIGDYDATQAALETAIKKMASKIAKSQP